MSKQREDLNETTKEWLDENIEGRSLHDISDEDFDRLVRMARNGEILLKQKKKTRDRLHELIRRQFDGGDVPDPYIELAEIYDEIRETDEEKEARGEKLSGSFIGEMDEQ